MTRSTTELDAVNSMLSTIAESPVSTLDGTHDTPQECAQLTPPEQSPITARRLAQVRKASCCYWAAKNPPSSVSNPQFVPILHGRPGNFLNRRARKQVVLPPLCIIEAIAANESNKALGIDQAKVLHQTFHAFV